MQNNEQTLIVDFKEGMTLTGFFLVKRAELKYSEKTNKYYVDAVLADKSGEVSTKIWQGDESVLKTFESGKLVKIKAKVKLWNGKPQLSVSEYRMSTQNDGISIKDFTPTAPGNPEDYFAYIGSRIDIMKDDNLRILVKALVLDKKDSLLIYPAAKSNHHSFRSGLIYHIYRMLRTAEKISEVYSEEVNIDLLNAGIILHDLCKIDEMLISEVGLVTEYSVEGNLLGHISIGVSQVMKKAAELGITGEIPVLLSHLILSHHYQPEFGSPVLPMFIEAELLHHIDIMDSRIYDFDNVYKTLRPGEMSEPVWTLDKRRVYKPLGTK